MNELSTERIFPVTLLANTHANELRMEIQFVGDMTEAQTEQWSLRFSETFLALIRAGGLGGALHAPRLREALFEVTWNFAENDIGTLVDWVIPDVVVAPEAMRILVNLAESAMYDFENVIFSLSLAYGPTPLAIESLGLPAEWPECPFEVEEYSIESNDFDIEVVLAKPLTGERVRPLIDPIATWFNTVKFCGFGGHPYAQWKPGLETNEKLISTAGSSLIFHVRAFYARLDSLSSLINVLIAIDQAGEKIESVVIGE